MKKFQSLCWMIVLAGMVILPAFIPFGSESLMEWQKETIGWNFIGVSSNYLLFFIYFLYRKKPKAAFGLHMGKLKQHLLWFTLVTFIFIACMRGFAYFIEGPLVFQIPPLQTILFQFIFVALGEELFWRGTIQSEFGIAIATIGFGLFHLIPNVIMSILIGQNIAVIDGMAQVAFAMVIGIILGVVRIKTDSIYACALLHGLYGLSNHTLIAAVSM